MEQTIVKYGTMVIQPFAVRVFLLILNIKINEKLFFIDKIDIPFNENKMNIYICINKTELISNSYLKRK